MATEALLNALNDTLTDLLTKRNEINKAIGNQTYWVTTAHECLKSDENAEALAELKLKKIEDQLKALGMHVNGLSEQPKVLQNRISKLSGDRIEAHREHQAAIDKLVQAKKNLQTAKNRMELEESRLKDIQTQIQEVQREIIGVT